MNDKKYTQHVANSYMATINMHKEKQREEQLREKEEERRKMLRIQEDLQ